MQADWKEKVDWRNETGREERGIKGRDKKGKEDKCMVHGKGNEASQGQQQHSREKMTNTPLGVRCMRPNNDKERICPKNMRK